jgi:hypothetical protein
MNNNKWNKTRITTGKYEMNKWIDWQCESRIRELHDQNRNKQRKNMKWDYIHCRVLNMYWS